MKESIIFKMLYSPQGLTYREYECSISEVSYTLSSPGLDLFFLIFPIGFPLTNSFSSNSDTSRVLKG